MNDSVLTTDWTAGVRSLAEAKDFSYSLCPDQLSPKHWSAHPEDSHIRCLSSSRLDALSVLGQSDKRGEGQA
jgi:hypothetical protein